MKTKNAKGIIYFMLIRLLEAQARVAKIMEAVR